MHGNEINSFERVLWSDKKDLNLLLTFTDGNICIFTVTRKDVIHKEWQHVIKHQENVSIKSLRAISEPNYVLRIIWNSNKTVYCDHVTISRDGATAVATETVLVVDFNITRLHILWSHGIVCVQEEIVDHLHIFNTGHNQYLGFITLFSNSDPCGSLVHFDHDTMSMWVIAARYDKATKTSSAHLNTYFLPDFKLQTTVTLPRYFTHYTFARESPTVANNTSIANIESILVCCSCDILHKSTIQWYLTPKKAWKEAQLNHYVKPNLNPTIDQKLESTNNLYRMHKDTIQPSSPILEFNFLSS